MERVWVVIPAGGRGQRFGAAQAKQYVLLRGRPVIAHTLAAFLREPRVAGIQLVLPGEDIAAGAWRELLGPMQEPFLSPVAGGALRADSVRLGLEALLRQGAGVSDWVLVHDAARPCLRREDLLLLLDSLAHSPQGALLAVPVTDTLKRAENAHSLGTVDREGLWRALTPQAFPLGALLTALEAARGQNLQITDEASAMEWQGWRPRLIHGHGDNIKVTLQDDLVLAAAVLAARDKEE
ncbi:2-C-methyl-D-erythritol 4-phosphate cytidylyltransferase [Acidithiobacillus sp.]|mgnify:CR=1 FL=1|uniref:2-C-methyl-D-erythritol 4-phosphate cytidylyltransferase n=1 Tax=Acidithiobacillus sp. TaxID=1872118 RepID=UPI0025C6E358|nr:2-C-methyl-D-erythritol 4-phosphate cytidylyltransferase [Acidithiobacillus sp.]